MCLSSHNLMTRLASILAVLVACLSLIGNAHADDPARSQVSAATANALSALRTDVRSTRITSALTVAQFLDQTAAAEAFDDTIRQAQQIGAPRWVDDQTCQVRLELSGAKIAYSLVAIAATRPKLSPIPAAALEQTLSDWKARSFGATGTSISASKAPGIRPVDGGERWGTISDESRSAAMLAARQDATQRLIDNIRPITISDSQTVGDLLQREPVQKAVRSWVMTQPVTQVRFRDDLQVELTIATPSEELLQTVIDSARGTEGTTLPSDAKSLDDLEREFSRRVSASIGRASATETSVTTRTVAATIELPDRPPEWVGTLLTTEASSPGLGTPLGTKSAAERKATENLRARINALPLTRTQALEEAARQNPRIADAIDRTLLRARVYGVSYGADRSIAVKMSIDSNDLWTALRYATGQ